MTAADGSERRGGGERERRGVYELHACAKSVLQKGEERVLYLNLRSEASKKRSF
jgi:hypothetical protein